MTTRTTAALGAALGAAATLLALAGVPQPQLSGAALAADTSPKYEYQVATVDMLGHTVKIGEQVTRHPSSRGFDEMLTATAQEGGWRVIDVYTVGTFGPFFLMERLAR